MFFSDLENFRGSLNLNNDKRKIDYKKVHFKITEDIIKLMDWEKYNPRLIRGYFYTGIYTNPLMKKMKNHFKDIERSEKIGKDKKETILNENKLNNFSTIIE